VVGIGHELRGDDAAGVLVARALQSLAPPHGPLLIVDAGSAPENCTGALRRFRPDLVLLIDAAEFGAAPGTARWLEWRAAEGCGVSTHTLPVALVADYLTVELGCVVELLGIQPARTWFDTPLSDQVALTIDDVARTLAEVFALNLKGGV
jgi:hydrogenase 3 maturation protease